MPQQVRFGHSSSISQMNMKRRNKRFIQRCHIGKRYKEIQSLLIPSSGFTCNARDTHNQEVSRHAAYSTVVHAGTQYGGLELSLKFVTASNLPYTWVISMSYHT